MTSALLTLYLHLLSKYPLVTKGLTAAVLASLNEQIASAVAGDVKTTQVAVPLGSRKMAVRIRHTLTWRVVLMAAYGFAVATPILHYGYAVLNKAFPQPLLPRTKVAQILALLATITPANALAFLTFTALVNMPAGTGVLLLAARYREQGAAGVVAELRRLAAAVATNLHNNLATVLRTLWVVLPLAMALAQRLLDPRVWVVFFNVVFFVLGTVQNLLVKMRLRLAREASEQEKVKQE